MLNLNKSPPGPIIEIVVRQSMLVSGNNQQNTCQQILTY